ncbi:hypothetical protein [Roseobacter sp. HKCC-CH-9208]
MKHTHKLAFALALLASPVAAQEQLSIATGGTGGVLLSHGGWFG